MKRSKPIGSSASSRPSRPERRQTVGELRALQRLMAGAIMRPLSGAEGMRPRWIDGRSMKEVVAGFIKPNDRLTSFERLEIYNRQYWYRLIDCFFDDFPGVRAVLGQDKFLKLALAYLERHPSSSFTLRNLGQHFVQFIESEPARVRPHGELALEMARLEWAYIEAFDNEAKPPVTLDDLLGRAAGELNLRLQPYITLLRLNHSGDDFLISLRRKTGLRHATSNAVEKERTNAPTRLLHPPARKTVHLAVHRYQSRVFYKRLRPDQFALLSALKTGATLEEAVLAPAVSPRPEQIKAWFEDWSLLGWFWLDSEKVVVGAGFEPAKA